MLDRGRSRHVSQVALARRLSEEQARQFVPEHVIIWPPCPPPRRATKTRAINTAGFNSALASSTLPRLVLPSHSPSATGPASGSPRPGSSRQTAATLQPRTTTAASTETPTRCGLLSPPTCYLPSLSDGSSSNPYGSPGSSRTASVSPAVSPSEPLTPHCGATDYIDFVPPVVYDAVSESLIVDESSQARDVSECSPIVIDLDPNDTWEDITDGPGLTLPPEFEEALAVEEAASARKRVEEELWTERGRWAEKVERRWERMRRIMREQRDLGRQARAEHEAFVASQTARKVKRKVKIASKSSTEIHPTHFSTITGRLINGTARASGSTSVPPSPTATRSSNQTLLDSSLPAEVPMQEVFNSMHGALFDDSEETGVKLSSELCHLLEPVAWERGERWAKYNRMFGNGEERPDYRVVPRRRDSGNGEECLTCKPGLSCPDTSASQSSFATSTRSALSRATGWISFRSSRDSTSSSATSVTSSALSTKAPSLYPSNESTSHQILSSSLIVSLPRRCECPTSWRLVAHGDDPLTYNEEGPTTKPYAYEDVQDQRYLIQPARSSSLPLRAGWRRLCESVAVFVDSAHRLQEAYLNATLVSNPAYDAYDPYPRRRPSPSYSRSYSRVRNMSPYETSDSLALRSRPKPGYRVTNDSLRQFLLEDAAPIITPTAGKSMIPPSLPPRTITLRDLSPATRLRVFAPLPIPPRSPLKPRWAPRQPEGRYRPVSNRCFLRIRALVNICAAEGITWEGVTPVPIGTVMLPGGSGAVATGAERLRGVAMDGIGFSALRREILLE